MKELRNKSPKYSNSPRLIEERDEFNRIFKTTTEDIELLKKEILPIIKDVLEIKDYWLEITGEFSSDVNIRWTGKLTIEDIDKITRMNNSLDIDVISKSVINPIEAKIRWGYGIGLNNLRIDIS